MASLLRLYLALTSCRFSCGFALSALFSDSNDITAPPTALLDGSLWDSADESLFGGSKEILGDVSGESLWGPDIWWSSCATNGIEQPSKLRGRDDICPSPLQNPPTPQIQVPELPTFFDIENAVAKKPQKIGPDRTVIKVIPVNGLDMRTDDPRYYCARFAESSYTIPVCGSGSLTDRINKLPPYYAKIENSRLIVGPYNSWTCVESEFFCCVQWTQYSSPPLGTGYECVNLKEFGWDGYDTDTFNLPGSDPSATGESLFSTPLDEDFHLIP